MDPFTAAMNAFAAFNNFLVTPAGQKLALNQEEIIATLLAKLGVHIGAAPAPTPTVPPATKVLP